ncbi:extracellular solute-binding protein [Candidatus Sumerlaeota bacterium]|nr:extracellular solute-binding protein [Candidatus Sumerlaeota bacterium]
MKLRSVFGGILTGALMMMLAACGGPASSDEGGGAPAPAPTPVPEGAAESATDQPAEPAAPALRLPEISAEGWGVGERPDPVAVEGPVTVTFWHAIAQRHEAALLDVIASFEAEYPNINIEPVYQGSYTDLRTALVAALSTPNKPVMSQMYESWTSQFIEADLLVPVQAFINADPTFGDAELDGYFSSFLENNRWGETLVTLPFNKSLYLLFANLDLLEGAGLGVPTTWEEMRTAAQTLTVDNRRGFGVRPLMETFTPLFLMNGGDFLTADGQPDLESEACLETLQCLIDLMHTDDVCYLESGYLTAAFANQSIALLTGSSAGISYTDRQVGDAFRWVVAPLPSHGDNPRRVLSQGTNVGIYADHDPQTLWAAWEFLKFLTNAESSAHFAAISGYLPVQRGSLEVPELANQIASDPNTAVATSQLEYAAFEPRMPEWETIRDSLNSLIGQMLTNSTLTAERIAGRMMREARQAIED